MNSVEDAITAVRERIAGACGKAGRDPGEVTLIAVTKNVEFERIKAALQFGIGDLGENYIQEALGKVERIGRKAVTWHMIGHIQSNKARHIPDLFDVVHSVDRWEILERLDKYEKPIKVLIELNLSGEPTKHGTDENGLKGILEKIDTLEYIKPIGLMTMAPYVDNPEKVRHIFGTMRTTLAKMNSAFGLAMSELSMGISSDFEVAIEEGATMVRIGTAIFGERS